MEADDLYTVADPEGFHPLPLKPLTSPLQVETGSYPALTDLAQSVFH